MKLRRPSGLTLLAAALLMMMPALAVLQFRWVGQVSDAEQVRMQRNVENAALQFRESFNNEIRRASQELGVNAVSVRDANWDAYATRYERWENDAPHPEMIRSVYAVTAEGGELRVLKWDPEGHTFNRVEWPDALQPWRNDFVGAQEDFKVAVTSQDRPAPPTDRAARFQDQDSLLLAPLGEAYRTTRASVNPSTGFRQVRSTSESIFGYTVIELDLDYIKAKLLPELSQHHFSHPSGDTYRVAVISNDDDDQVIYRSEDGVTTKPGDADVTMGFFSRFGPPRGGRPPTATQPDRRGQANTPSLSDLPGRWRLIVQHQSGSLEAAVAGVRRRNLALSFGVLILLTISIGLLTITSRKAQRLAEQQIEFVAGVSHELRTPVAVIRSAAENLSQGVVGSAERVKRYGQMIEGEARRLGEMVERVLQYAGIQSGLGYGARTSLAPAEIIHSAVDSAIPLLGPDTVDIHRDIPDSLPHVTGDAAALRSAVQNLVANAVKYGGEDRWVGIRAEHVREHRRSEVRITVSDHGAGIPASELPHIFEPFYRGGDALARQIHGNGLGLSLVKRIVAAHGGRVTVETRAGVGSSFTISLPAAQPDVASTSVAGEMRAAAHS